LCDGPHLYGHGRNDRLTAAGVVPGAAHLSPHSLAVERPPDGLGDGGAVGRALGAGDAAIDQLRPQQLFAGLKIGDVRFENAEFVDERRDRQLSGDGGRLRVALGIGFLRLPVVRPGRGGPVFGRASLLSARYAYNMRPMQSNQHVSGDIAVYPAITAAQCRAGRALIEISRADLAKAAGVGERTLADFESRTRTPIRATLAAIQRALEAAGVEFLPDNGVKLRTAPHS
jgi:hypothetical protein